jgi:hypothetical protein
MPYSVVSVYFYSTLTITYFAAIIFDCSNFYLNLFSTSIIYAAKQYYNISDNLKLFMDNYDLFKVGIYDSSLWFYGNTKKQYCIPTINLCVYKKHFAIVVFMIYVESNPLLFKGCNSRP